MTFLTILGAVLLLTSPLFPTRISMHFGILVGASIMLIHSFIIKDIYFIFLNIGAIISNSIYPVLRHLNGNKEKYWEEV